VKSEERLYVAAEEVEKKKKKKEGKSRLPCTTFSISLLNSEERLHVALVGP